MFNMYYFLYYTVLYVTSCSTLIQLLFTQHKKFGCYIEILLQDLDTLV